MSPSVRFLKSSDWSMHTLRNMSEEALVVLFTPVMPPLVGSASTSLEATDPFEILGRTLSRYHARIRHVPYVPAVGLTDTHLAWLRRAGAVLTVNCESVVEIKDVNPEDSLASQASFATAVLDAMHSMRADAGDVTFSCIHCGTRVGHAFSAYDIIIQSQTYTSTDLQEAAKLLLDWC
ncbi:hypothetical protein H2203_005292 [Taxawa tesnikishii (nom. ined.)]|nr:hypothetical protein H2203_005292 [Dothideales sp. JES 119]